MSKITIPILAETWTYICVFWNSTASYRNTCKTLRNPVSLIRNHRTDILEIKRSPANILEQTFCLGHPDSGSMSVTLGWTVAINTSRPRQNGRHFADDIFSIFLDENARISLKLSLKFVPKVRINNIPALVQIMAWRRPGDKPLSEPMVVSLLTHICVTRPQWVNKSGGVLLGSKNSAVYYSVSISKYFFTELFAMYSSTIWTGMWIIT